MVRITKKLKLSLLSGALLLKQRVIYGLVGVLCISVIASVVMMKETDKPILPIHHVESFGSLGYEIKLDKNQFGSDEVIEVDAKLTNEGKETFTYKSGSSSCPTHIDIRIVNKNKKTELVMRSEKRSCTFDESITQLAPAQTVENKYLSIPGNTSDLIFKPVSAGTYYVEVYLSPEGGFGKERKWKLVSKIPITLQQN